MIEIALIVVACVASAGVGWCLRGLCCLRGLWLPAPPMPEPAPMVASLEPPQGAPSDLPGPARCAHCGLPMPAGAVKFHTGVYLHGFCKTQYTGGEAA